MDNEFNKALNNFINEFSCGREIRHLADLGYSAKDIKERLLYPVSIEIIRKEYTRHLLNKGILSFDGLGNGNMCYEYVQEQDEYGKRTYRRIEKHVEAVGEDTKEYVKIRFTRSGKLKNELYEYLNQKQISYLESIDWTLGMRFHCKNDVLTAIVNAIPQTCREEFF